MIVDEKNKQSLSAEVGDKLHLNPDSQKYEINPNLNIKKDALDNYSSNYYEETDSLKYDSSYKANQCDEQKNILRKSSTISTNISQSENGFDNISPIKNIKESNNSSFINFNRERFFSMPISNYFDGIDNYFKGLYPEKNNYQKSKNYLEKKYFFREHFPSVDIDYINKKNEKIAKREGLTKIEKISDPHPPPMGQNSQISQNIGKIECPFYYFSYCSIDCKILFLFIYFNI